MTYLADTHTPVWWDAIPERIGRRARVILNDEAAEVMVSHASIWELAIKLKLAKLTLPLPLNEWVRESVTDAGFRLEPISLPAILGTQNLPYHHGDPFDRLLISQALELRVPVLSADKHWDAYGVERIWD